MELTQEQLDQIINSILSKVQNKIDSTIKEAIQELDIPDTRNLATKKLVTDSIEALRNGLNEEVVKLQAAIKQVADETDVKIGKLTPPKEKPWWGTLLD